MSKKTPKRLQGPEWYAKKDSLIMTAYKINEKGHIKGQYMDMDGNLYSHWFSNKEIEEFKEMSEPKEEEKEDDLVKAYNEVLKGVTFGKDISEKFDKAVIEHFSIPAMSDLAIDESINNILGREDLIMQMNKLVLEDEKERYVRELLNRLNNVIEYCENYKITDQVDYTIIEVLDYVAKIANGDVPITKIVDKRMDQLNDIIKNSKEWKEIENEVLRGSGEEPKGLMQELENKGDTNE